MTGLEESYYDGNCVFVTITEPLYEVPDEED